MSNKKVFISYSWTNPTHEEWTLNLAHRLVNDGIDVVFDKWDLKEGHDKFAFMEKSVHATDIDKVLIVLDSKYKEKADGRSGGVGTETLIISPKVYESTTQEKFIPIVAELQDDGSAPLPAYLSGKIYIDMSDADKYEQEYEKLLRNIYQRPLLAKPKLGTPPSHLFEDTEMNFKTTLLVRNFKPQLDKYPERINSMARDFFNEFIESLKDFAMFNTSNVIMELGKQTLNNINQTLPLKNDFILFLDQVLKSGFNFDLSIITSFLERLGSLLMDENQENNKRISSFENFLFLVNEIFISTIAIALKREHYPLLHEIFYTKYFIYDRRRSRVEAQTYSAFDTRAEYFDDFYKEHTGQNYYSPQATLMISRLTDNLKKEDFAEADLLCFYISQFTKDRWFPKSYFYKDDYSKFFSFLSRLISKQHFEKTKIIFQVETAEELKRKITALGEAAESERGYYGVYGNVPGVLTFVKLDEIATSL